VTDEELLDACDSVDLTMVERVAYNHLISFSEGLFPQTHTALCLKDLCIEVLVVATERSK
jgi:hypothetical protein